MKRQLFAFVLALAGFASSDCAAALVGFYFSGTVTLVTPRSDPFQAGFVVSLPVSGHALYDSASAPTDPEDGCVCMGYRQNINNGFSAMIGSTLFQADDYLIQIEKKHDKDLGDYDQLLVKFSGGLNPKLPSPLDMNGTPYPNSFMDVILVAASGTFVNASLPTSLDLSLFNSQDNILDENFGDFGLDWKNTTLRSFTAGDGDYDENGSVNSDDYAMWRSSFGSTTTFDADGNGNGVVDATDYVVWRQHESLLASSGSVPEPTCGLLIASTLGALAFRRTRID
ncbi:MAG TPA: hypothetical protein VH107_00340 [Lacipirellulaceae bacterium]|jgi:hypothetical protein|nr:hypothetical protein [Lacipirellulaceae bacterium]